MELSSHSARLPQSEVCCTILRMWTSTMSKKSLRCWDLTWDQKGCHQTQHNCNLIVGRIRNHNWVEAPQKFATVVVNHNLMPVQATATTQVGVKLEGEGRGEREAVNLPWQYLRIEREQIKYHDKACIGK